VTIFKVHYGKLTLKIYTKGERVLRIEVILHNAREYRWAGRCRAFPISFTACGHSRKIPERGGCMNACFVSDDMLEQLPEPTQVGETKVGGIDLNKHRMRRAAEAVLALSASPAGFTASEWDAKSAR